MKTQPTIRYAAAAITLLAACTVGIRLHATPQDPPKIAPPAPLTMFRNGARPPEGAIILFSGKPEELANNFYKRYTKNPGDWTVDAQGVSTPNSDDITSKIEVGDCVIHAEFQCTVDANGKSIGEGNSGVGVHGRYEIQILDSFGRKANAQDCGALYNQKAPLANPSKKPGEWQTFDIIFRSPRFDADGKVTEKPRATVFLNGVLVQNNEEFNGPTGIQYGEFKGMTKTGPIILQGDHSPVHFRNVWVVPL